MTAVAVKWLAVGVVSLGLGLAPVAVNVVAAAPQPASGGEPRAAAWLLDLSTVSGTAGRVQVAAVRAQSGDTPQAWGAPISVNGTAYQEAGASSATPHAETAAMDYDDQTGSMSMTGGFTRANVAKGSADVRTGFGALSGSSFAMSSKLLTWDQQTMLLGQFAALNDAVFDPLNARLQALAPVLGAAGIEVPTLTKMSPLALINVGAGNLGNAHASAASAPGMSSAQAAVSLGDVQLFDGFITLNDVTASADSQSVDGSQTRRSSVKIGSISVAGLEVTLDDTGFKAAGTSWLTKSTVQPGLDLLSATLKAQGITLRAGEATGTGDLREATAFQLRIATPQASFDLSIGHVEASAATVAAQAQEGSPVMAPDTAPPPPGEAPALVTPPAAPVAIAPAVDLPAAAPVQDAVVAPAAPHGTAAAARGVPRWLGATLPAAVARALGTVYLLLLLAGIGTALIPILLMHPRPTQRRTPLLAPEVRP